MKEREYFNFLGKIKGNNSIILIAGEMSFKNNTRVGIFRFNKIRGLDIVYKLLTAKFTKDIALYILKHYLNNGVHFMAISTRGSSGPTYQIKTEISYSDVYNSYYSMIFKNSLNPVDTSLAFIPFQNQITGEILTMKIIECYINKLNSGNSAKKLCDITTLSLQNDIIDFIMPVQIKSGEKGWRLILKKN